MLNNHHFLTICFIIFFSGISLLHSNVTDTLNTTMNLDVNISSNYTKAASYLLSSMNQSINPCDDFFEYACGGWISKHPIPSDLGGYEILTILGDKVASEMKSLYDSEQSTGSKALDAIKMMYHSCMDTDRLSNMSGREMIEAIEYLGKWPMACEGEWLEEEFDFTETMIRIAKTRSSAIFLNIFVSYDQSNVSRRTIYVDRGKLALGFAIKEYYLDEKKYEPQLKAYKNYIIEKAMLISNDTGVSKNRTEIGKEADAVISFEKKLAQIMVPTGNQRNYTLRYHQYHLNDLSLFMPQMDWNKYFQNIIPSDLHWYLNQNPVIIVIEVEFLKQLNKLIEVTSNRTLANYMIWLFTLTWSFQLDERYDEIHQEFLQAIIGKQIKSPRWKVCSQIVAGKMAHAAGALYVKSFFDEVDKQIALEMVNYLKDAFKEMLREYKWLHKSTRQKALKKVNKMLSLIGYPEFVQNITLLDNYYKLLVIHPNDTFAQIITKTSRWSMKRSYRMLMEPVSRTEAYISASVVNAYYASVENALIFPAAIFQAPYFDRTFPKAMNFGGIGSVIGHEIVHGFGNLEVYLDERQIQNLKQTCFTKKYNNYTVPGTELHINGQRTLNENIADNGGIKGAFRAYRNYVKKIGHDERRIPELEHLDMNQIFFLSNAQIWCGHSRPAALIRQVLTDQHVPLRFRVNGVLVNQPDFAKAFKCPTNSSMNPELKCSLW